MRHSKQIARDDPEFFAGQVVEVVGVLAPPPVPVAEGLFDYRVCLRRQGVYLSTQRLRHQRLAAVGRQADSAAGRSVSAVGAGNAGVRTAGRRRNPAPDLSDDAGLEAGVDAGGLWAVHALRHDRQLRFSHNTREAPKKPPFDRCRYRPHFYVRRA